MTLIKENLFWLYLLLPVVPYILSPRKCSCTPALAGPGENILLTSYNAQQISVDIIKINPGDKAVKVSLNGPSVDIKSSYERLSIPDAKILFWGEKRVFWVKGSKFWRENAVCFVNADIPLFRYVSWLLADLFSSLFSIYLHYTQKPNLICAYEKETKCPIIL